MIFYFSGIYPAGALIFPDDPELNAFRDTGTPYNRMVCPVYEKEAEYIYRNIRRAKKHDNIEKQADKKPGSGKTSRGRKR